jgi:hypothetical protein
LPKIHKPAKSAPIGVRLEPETRKALEVAAEDESRTLANMIERAVIEYLRKHGYLTK